MYLYEDLDCYSLVNGTFLFYRKESLLKSCLEKILKYA